MKTTLFCLLLFAGFASGCNGQKPQTLEEKSPDEITVMAAAVEDTTVYDMPYNTAILEDAAEYFRKNNRFKDWDKNDQKRILVRAVIEKDSTASNVQVLSRDVENAELKEEAARLIREAKISPALNEKGEKVRSKWTNIVFFPPK